MMNKYLLVFLVLAVSLALDLGTKTVAENRLASRTTEYQHYMYLDVPPEAEGLSLSDYLTEELTWSSEEEINTVATQTSYVVNEDGDILRPGSPDLVLRGGERLEIQHRTATVIDGFLAFRYVENRGAAWGFLSGFNHSLRRPFFIGIGIIAIGVIFLLVRSSSPDRRFLLIALALIMGGAAGNIVDRIRYGYVVDFILWHPGFDWPTFNIADLLIVIGVSMMFIEIIRDAVRQKKQQEVKEEV